MVAIKELGWSEESYTPQELLNKEDLQLPVFVEVADGFMGRNNIETLSTGQAARIETCIDQPRALLRDTRGRLLSFPEDFPYKFQLRKKNGKWGRGRLLRHIIRDGDLPVQAIFDYKKPIFILIGSEYHHSDFFGPVEILKSFVQKFLAGNTVNGGIIDRSVMLLPLYLKVHLRVAYGLKKGTEADWTAMQDMYSRAVSHIKFNKIKGIKSILIHDAEEFAGIDKLQVEMFEVQSTLGKSKKKKQKETKAIVKNVQTANHDQGDGVDSKVGVESNVEVTSEAGIQSPTLQFVVNVNKDDVTSTTTTEAKTGKYQSVIKVGDDNVDDSASTTTEESDMYGEKTHHKGHRSIVKVGMDDDDSREVRVVPYDDSSHHGIYRSRRGRSAERGVRTSYISASADDLYHYGDMDSQHLPISEGTKTLPAVQRRKSKRERSRSRRRSSSLSSPQYGMRVQINGEEAVQYGTYGRRGGPALYSPYQVMTARSYVPVKDHNDMNIVRRHLRSPNYVDYNSDRMSEPVYRDIYHNNQLHIGVYGENRNDQMTQRTNQSRGYDTMSLPVSFMSPRTRARLVDFDHKSDYDTNISYDVNDSPSGVVYRGIVTIGTPPSERRTIHESSQQHHYQGYSQKQPKTVVVTHSDDMNSYGHTRDEDYKRVNYNTTERVTHSTKPHDSILRRADHVPQRAGRQVSTLTSSSFEYEPDLIRLDEVDNDYMYAVPVRGRQQNEVNVNRHEIHQVQTRSNSPRRKIIVEQPRRSDDSIFKKKGQKQEIFSHYEYDGRLKPYQMAEESREMFSHGSRGSHKMHTRDIPITMEVEKDTIDRKYAQNEIRHEHAILDDTSSASSSEIEEDESPAGSPSQDIRVSPLIRRSEDIFNNMFTNSEHQSGPFYHGGQHENQSTEASTNKTFSASYDIKATDYGDSKKGRNLIMEPRVVREIEISQNDSIDGDSAVRVQNLNTSRGSTLTKTINVDRQNGAVDMRYPETSYQRRSQKTTTVTHDPEVADLLLIANTNSRLAQVASQSQDKKRSSKITSSGSMNSLRQALRGGSGNNTENNFGEMSVAAGGSGVDYSARDGVTSKTTSEEYTTRSYMSNGITDRVTEYKKTSRGTDDADAQSQHSNSSSARILRKDGVTVINTGDERPSSARRELFTDQNQNVAVRPEDMNHLIYPVKRNTYMQPAVNIEQKSGSVKSSNSQLNKQYEDYNEASKRRIFEQGVIRVKQPKEHPTAIMNVFSDGKIIQTSNKTEVKQTSKSHDSGSESNLDNEVNEMLRNYEEMIKDVNDLAYGDEVDVKL